MGNSTSDHAKGLQLATAEKFLFDLLALFHFSEQPLIRAGSAARLATG